MLNDCVAGVSDGSRSRWPNHVVDVYILLHSIVLRCPLIQSILGIAVGHFSWKTFLNPFSTNVPLLYTLKISENRSFFYVFRGYRSGTMAENGLRFSKKFGVFKSFKLISMFQICKKYVFNVWGKVFKNWRSNICGRQPLKHLNSLEVPNAGAFFYKFTIENEFQSF